MTNRKRAALVLWGLTVGSLAVLVSDAPTGAQSDACAITWGSGAKDAGTNSTGEIIDSRTGRHPCYDRVVFELDGPADGYRVRYATEVSTEGEGQVLGLEGAAFLRVTLRNPAYDADTGAPTYPFPVGEHTADVTGYQTLRDVVFGGSFEGQSTFGIGVRARLPFRVMVLAGPMTHSRIIIDVAHHW